MSKKKTWAMLISRHKLMGVNSVLLAQSPKVV